MSDHRPQWIDPVLYFATLIALTAPFLLVSTHLPLLAAGLPASAFAVVCPTVAALLVSRLRHGSQAVRESWVALVCLPIQVNWAGLS